MAGVQGLYCMHLLYDVETNGLLVTVLEFSASFPRNITEQPLLFTGQPNTLLF